MKPLVFTLKKRPAASLDLSPLTPDRLAGKNINVIRKIKLNCSGTEIAVRDIFELSGDNTENLHFRRASKIFTHIGNGMTFGEIDIRGHSGDYLGQEMTGGIIKVRGDSGDWTGRSMAGGRIDISGSVGNFTGGALPEYMHGMSNGIITISGNAGDRTGDRMRRGTILILGDAGSYTGSRMIAGTIVILGRTSTFCGYGMKRGTIILGKKPASIPATFSSCGKLKMEFLRLLYKQLASLGRKFTFFKEYGPEVHKYAGDSSTKGKGEILIMINAV